MRAKISWNRCQFQVFVVSATLIASCGEPASTALQTTTTEVESSFSSDDLTLVTSAGDSPYLAGLKVALAEEIGIAERIDDSGLDVFCVSRTVLDDIGEEALLDANIDRVSVLALPEELLPSEERRNEITFKECVIEELAKQRLIRDLEDSLSPEQIDCLVVESGSIGDFLLESKTSPSSLSERISTSSCIKESN